MSGRGRGPINEPPSVERPDNFPVRGRIEFGSVWPCGFCKTKGKVRLGGKSVDCPQCRGTGYQTRRPE